MSSGLGLMPLIIGSAQSKVIQDRELIFRRHGITHIRYASLFFTPCDAQGRAVTVYDDGRPIELYDSTGCYRSAADQYDTGRLEPATYARQN
jgi:hypothetical protein